MIAMGFKRSIVSSGYAAALPIHTRSLCPTCLRPLDALIVQRNNQVRIERSCPAHGDFSELYWEDADYYERARRFATQSRGIDNPNVGKIVPNTGLNCPFDCGLCANHHSHTALANVVLTTRCQLSCWYCFFYAKQGQPVYEPSLEQLRAMFRNLRREQPVPTDAIQFTGGEPTLREDLLEIVAIAKEEGFDHIQLNTHGIGLMNRPDFVQKLREAGVMNLYLSFDGVSPQANPKNHWEIPGILDSLRKGGLGAVLVPTVIRGVNDHELGGIVNFGLNHLDVVKGINFQPVSLVGRMPKALREKHRITIPGAIQKIEEQTNGIIGKEDFFPVPCTKPLTNFVETLTALPQYDLSIHFACGAATYVFRDGKRIIPLPRFVDIAGLFEFLNEKSIELEKGAQKHLLLAKMLLKLESFIDHRYQPAGLNFGRLLLDVLVRHDYSALGTWHDNSLFIGMMHFMDPYLYDQMRVERCAIHYALPDGRIIPFCSFNVLPEIYRDKIQAQYSVSAATWEAVHPNQKTHPRYVRKEAELKAEPVYTKTYSDLTDFFVLSKEEAK